jgi:hypothetical protein
MPRWPVDLKRSAGGTIEYLSTMADAPVPSLSRAREEKISELSTYFANDDLTLEELERRIERVYKSSSVTELDTITADLKSAATRPDEYARGALAPQPRGRAVASAAVPSGRIMSIMSSTRRVGRWAVPQKLDIVGIMSDSGIDLTHATLPPGIVDIELRLVMTSFKLVVPPGMRVINEAHSFMASIHSRADEFSSRGMPATGNETVIRLTGYALMADVNIVVRRSELPMDDDEWDED